MKSHFYELRKDSENEFYSSLKNICLANELVYKTVYSKLNAKGVYKTRDGKLTITKKYFKDMQTASQSFHSKFAPFLLKVSSWSFSFIKNEATFDYKNVAYKVKIYESKTQLYANDDLVLTSDNQQDIIDYIFC